VSTCDVSWDATLVAMRKLLLLGMVGVLALVLGVAASAQNATVADLPYAMVVRILSTDHYQIEVQNTDARNFIKSFIYTPPSGLTISAVTGVIGGTCSLNGAGGITCAGKLNPAICFSCVGASLIVNFSATGKEPTFANGFWTYYGVVGGLQVTGTIPVQKPTFGDLPVCKAGHPSTKAHPCVKG
jgi:hypothetical protein